MGKSTILNFILNSLYSTLSLYSIFKKQFKSNSPINLAFKTKEIFFLEYPLNCPYKGNFICFNKNIFIELNLLIFNNLLNSFLSSSFSILKLSE